MRMKNSEYDQEIQQSQTADQPMAQRERATQQSLSFGIGELLAQLLCLSSTRSGPAAKRQN